MFYILDENNNPVPADPLEAGKWKVKNHNERCKIAYDNLGHCRVSTVFLGIDHRYGNGPPLVFETMVFGPNDFFDRDVERYSTWDEAVQGHQLMIDRHLGLTNEGTIVLEDD